MMVYSAAFAEIPEGASVSSPEVFCVSRLKFAGLEL